ncbi:uncharacterized protein PHACADRAFT_249088 [Phanerochaete carnosa HHB-10118-sp]|uniref:Pentacotripeptide-repeat region of PRORP domain-containing protein n=1 Tax=Phanerochaete carnosa (strain HHB-10118-sp) TaxID=650164 RepID=K5WHX4_PHACS|nr:uncharacterized protein PHACADRAFT_249088 [Phanerochaete carnosa HHB-10118-sp]EKM58955.1 hypothetical protein PHACADRAFT_249088 [Phanerochaete carnosa HHB-10118-sp]
MVHGQLRAAYSLYSRMQDEGYIPPQQIQASMVVLYKLSTGNSTWSLTGAAEKAFAQESFDEEEFRYLLRIISSVTRLPPAVYDDLIQLFIKSRGKENYTLSSKTESLLAYIRTRRERMGEVRETNFPAEEGPLADRTTAHEQELKMLLNMAKKDPEIAPIIHSTIRRMRHNDEAHGRTLYNIMMSALADRRRYADVFSVYNMMIRGDKSILPNAYTFGILFRLASRFSGPRTIHSRKTKAPKDVPTMRALFRDMVYCHRIQTGKDVTSRTPAINGSLMNKILRTFIEAGDFAAAYVALRSYAVFKIPVLLATYRAVIGAIMQRLRHEHPYVHLWNDPGRFWSYRFLGSPPTVPEEINVGVMDGVLKFGTKAALQLDPIELYSDVYLQYIADAVSHYVATKDDRDIPELTYRKVWNARRKHPSYRMPTAVSLLGLVHSPVDVWSTQPLLRILNRAIFASRPSRFLPDARIVSVEIRNARTEMLPAFAPPSKESQKARLLNM